MLLPGQTSRTMPRRASSSIRAGSSAERTPWPMRVTGRSLIAAHTLSGPTNLAGMDGAAKALVVGQPIGRREVGRRELGLVAAHAEAHDIVMRLGHHGARHGERPLGPEMADADDDDAALDAEVAPGAVDAVFERLEPGVVGDAERRRALGRAEHLDIDRAFARRAREIGIDHVAEIARHAQGVQTRS